MKQKKVLIIIFSIILLIVFVGISYAWLTSTIFGKKEYILKAGDLDLILDETSNGLFMENQTPVEDSVGLASEGATFSVRNNGKSDICYQIYLEDMELSEDEIRVNDRFIKYSLDKDNVVGGAKRLISSGENPNRLLDEGEIRAGKSINYKLRLWFDTSVDGEYANQIFKGKLRIEAVQCNNHLPVMKSYFDSVDSDANYIEEVDYHAEEYRTKITNIVTKTDTILPNDIVASWDVSEAGDNSVVAYIENDGVGGYKLTIGGNGRILANKNSGYLFNQFTAVKSIDLSDFDTSNTTSMFAMFYNCTAVTNINVSSFDTAVVTSFDCMFCLCKSLLFIDVSNFDTSNATSMSSMFNSCLEMKSIDLRSFDTSTVTDMRYMFDNSSNLSQILVSDKWKTDQAETRYMFRGCQVDQVTVV